MRITINTGTDHELYNCHMRACMLFDAPGAMVEVQSVGGDPEIWIADLSDIQRLFDNRIRLDAIKAFNKAEACNPYAVEAFGKHTGGIR